MKIIINGVTGYTDDEEWTYEDIARVASLNPNKLYTCTYYVNYGYRCSRSGMLYPNEKVSLDDGMIINICDTSNA